MTAGRHAHDAGALSYRRALSNIAALSALPSLWLNADEHQIADSLADCLTRVLDLTTVRVFLQGRPVIEAAVPPVDPKAARSSKPSASLREFSVGIGLTTDSRLVAAAARRDFPTEAERLALTMAANQAAVAIARVTAERALRSQSDALDRERNAVAMLNRSLAHERDRFRQMFEQAPGFIALLRGPEHRFEFCNRSYLRLVGRDDLQGLPIREALPEVGGQGYFELLDEVYRSGEAYAAAAAPVDLRRDGDAALDRRYVDFIYQPIFDDDGRVSGILVEGHDVTEQVRAADHRQLLINELNHRVKNTLATVQSLAHQTLRDAKSVQEAKATLTSRLMSLSRAHDVLTRQNWEGAEIEEIVRQSVSSHVEAATERIIVEGPKLMLGPRSALALSMALHELGTNALKYGALSNDVGIVAVAWRVNGAEHANLEWRERGGPPIHRPPARKGFGSRLLKVGLATELGAAAELDFARAGVVCSVRLPLTEPVRAAPPVTWENPAARAGAVPLRPAGIETA